MPLPALVNPLPTLQSLHRAAQILAGLKMLTLPHEDGYLELSLAPTSNGLTTGKLPNGDEVRLLVGYKSVHYLYNPAGNEDAAALIQLDHTPTTQAQINAHLLEFAQSRLPIQLAGQGDALVQNFTDAVRARYADLPHSHTSFMETDTLPLDREVAHGYAHALDLVFTGIARFRARVKGHWTPLVVYPEHFDLSGVWYADPTFDEYKPQINIGFAPFSTGFDRPYWYATAYPYPDPMHYPALPAPARWHQEGWTGVVIDYDDIAAQDDPVLFIEQISAEVFAILRAMLPPT